MVVKYTGKHRKIKTEEFIPPLCPRCSGFTEYEVDGDVTVYFCAGSGTSYCNWSFIHGMSMGDPAWPANEERRPVWIPVDQFPYDEKGREWFAPGVQRCDDA